MLHALGGHAACLVALHSLSQPQTPREARFYLPAPRLRQFLRTAGWLGMRHAHPDAFLAGKLPRRSLILTFDDCYDDLHQELLPIMREEGFSPLLFAVAGQLGGSNVWDQETGMRPRSLMTVAQLREMQQAGAVIGAHSVSHAALPTLGVDAITREVQDSKSRLEDALGSRVDWFAYPYGEVDSRVRAAVEEAGFKAAVTLAPGLDTGGDRLGIRRVELTSNDTLPDMVSKVLTGKDIRRGLQRRARAQWLRLSGRASTS
ncbi:polysaccharide deacetylase family protein [Caenimonas sp. SL110]|uniref:polysaccharide deacetylase family protein n=1 Tax=Caenimonas sp. SL110 TaxID=1450524 RepID=UPI000652ECF0|nr:polysaccharide deacetylase family protein [Caenimonas sp. SL110]